ncbi:putative nuclease HARBI1 [Aphis gossypii]|uniref:putative nuclease HARBI1 n=1 Tax=Aphis gossypii TaxID=80765 RepID=UPI002158C158|nr:putative nuclease HARBI1 [Aphis gossypii]
MSKSFFGFVKTYKLSKNLTNYLIELVTPFIEPPKRSSALSVQDKVLITLQFFGTGSYQLFTCNSRYSAACQSSVSRNISEVTNALNQPTILNSWVKFPKNIDEYKQVTKRFYMKTGFPGVCGCIDCTRIAIVAPSGNLGAENNYPEHIYVNRKNYHSINTQLISVANLKILRVNALYLGSTHDSHIWNNCNVLPIVQELSRRNQCFYLLGDSGYALRPWLLIPIQNPVNEEELYNTKQMRARSLIERCNGLLKMRFRCLLIHRVLHYAPEKATAIINACVVLHNMYIT